MKELEKDELLEINGGASISATLINALSRAVSLITDLGRSLGSAIRRTMSGAYCKVK